MRNPSYCKSLNYTVDKLIALTVVDTTSYYDHHLSKQINKESNAMNWPGPSRYVNLKGKPETKVPNHLAVNSADAELRSHLPMLWLNRIITTKCIYNAWKLFYALPRGYCKRPDRHFGGHWHWLSQIGSVFIELAGEINQVKDPYVRSSPLLNITANVLVV